MKQNERLLNSVTVYELDAPRLAPLSWMERRFGLNFLFDDQPDRTSEEQFR